MMRNRYSVRVCDRAAQSIRITGYATAVRLYDRTPFLADSRAQPNPAYSARIIKASLIEEKRHVCIRCQVIHGSGKRPYAPAAQAREQASFGRNGCPVAALLAGRQLPDRGTNLLAREPALERAADSRPH